LVLSSSNPTDGATGISVNISPILTFNNIVDDYTVSLVNALTLATIPIATSLDVTKKILTIKPDGSLETATQYAIVITSITDNSGRTLKYTVIQFTTG
jgi:hypothetical protein